MKRYIDPITIDPNPQSQATADRPSRTVQTISVRRMCSLAMRIVGRWNCISRISPRTILLALCPRRYSRTRRDCTRRDCSWSRNWTSTRRKMYDWKLGFLSWKKKKISYPRWSTRRPSPATRAKADSKCTRGQAANRPMTARTPVYATSLK